MIDVQAGVVADAHDRDAVVGRIATLVGDARHRGVPIVWVQHNDPYMPIGSADWALVPELVPAAGEPRIDKQKPSSFEGTELEAILGRLGARELVVCGAQTDCCVHATLAAALDRGYRVQLVEDAHTTSDRAAVESENRACRERAARGEAITLVTAARASAP